MTYVLTCSDVDGHSTFATYDTKPSVEYLKSVLVDYHDEMVATEGASSLLDNGIYYVPGCGSCTSYKLEVV